MACEADPTDCGLYRLLCECNERCADEQCYDLGPACTADMECTSFSTPYCVTGRCAECREHGDCVAEGDRCIEGQCEPPCMADAECPLLYSCDGGTCVESGCASDRECAFVLGDGRARCAETECILACTDDAECDADRFEVCHEGRCVFAGCETDVECRAYLDLFDTSSGAHAVCR